jgi:hypothetical protein
MQSGSGKAIGNSSKPGLFTDSRIRDHKDSLGTMVGRILSHKSGGTLPKDKFRGHKFTHGQIESMSCHDKLPELL